jgi:hypothetical protein
MMPGLQPSRPERILAASRHWLGDGLPALLTHALLLISLAIPTALPIGARVVPAAWAGPVDWHEVPSSEEGRQWWDAGSLRRDRRGTLSVLSRFQPAAAPAEDPADEAMSGAEPAVPKPGRQPLGTLVVMELDCDLELYRDVAVNGLPRFNATWQPTGGDPLVAATLKEACAAATPPGSPQSQAG